jgi:nucleotide-binding universal stress UspA family protein
MFGRILLPLDGSRRSERALPYAAGLAKVFGSELALLHDETIGLRGDDVPASADALGRITDLVHALQNMGLLVWSGVVHGPAAEAILRAADDAQADLIVMSTHGRSGLGRWLYGSVADEVFRRTTLPIVLISAACERRWKIEGPFRLLVPLDGSPFAEAALGLAGEVADVLGAELVLLRVVEPADGFAALETSHLPAHSQRELDEAQAYLESAASSPGMAGRTITRHIVAGDPAAKIAAVARGEDVDLIVMATHGSGGLTRLTMGSVATSVLHRAATPMLLVRSVAAHPSSTDRANETSASACTVTVI